jgi:glycine/D-amino acid oxidase-like deaminating enzyme
MPAEGTPLVGKVMDGIYVAAGHSCWGITLGPGTGKVMSEMILDGKARSADVEDLSP